MIKIFSIVHAQMPIPGPVSTLPAPATNGTGAGTLQGLIYQSIDWAIWLAASVAVIYIIYSGFVYMTAGSDESKVKQARNGILYSLIGLVIIAMAALIVRWLGNILTFQTF